MTEFGKRAIPKIIEFANFSAPLPGGSKLEGFDSD